MPIHLRHIEVSKDVVEVLELLLENARLGNVTGIEFTCTMRKSRYITNILGRCQTNPTFTRGMVAHLDDELAQLSAGLDPSHTR